MSIFCGKPRYVSIVATTFLLLIAVSAGLLERDAHAGGQLACVLSLGTFCSGTSNNTSSLVGVALNWCGGDNTGGPCSASDKNTPNDPDHDYLVLSTTRTISTPTFEDWDCLFVPPWCEFKGLVDVIEPDIEQPIHSYDFTLYGGTDPNGKWYHVHGNEHYNISQVSCGGPPESGIGEAEPPATGSPQPPADGSPQQTKIRKKNGIYAVGAGVDGASIDLLGAQSDGHSFGAITNGRHAGGFGFAGMKVIAGDFNGDGRMDIGAVGAGVDGHSVDFLVALADGSGGFSSIANWRHADGFGWAGMMVVAGDFNGDGRWDIGAIGAGVNGTSVDLLVATSTGSSFNAIANWRHADGFGWGGLKPVAGDFDGDGRWDIGAIGAGVNGASVDLLVAPSTRSSFDPIQSWRHAEGFGWAGLAPASL